MWIALAPAWGGGVVLPLGEDGTRPGSPERVTDLARAVRERERTDSPRWVWADTSAVYPKLLADGVRVSRCHDLALTEALLLGHEGRWG